MVGGGGFNETVTLALSMYFCGFLNRFIRLHATQMSDSQISCGPKKSAGEQSSRPKLSRRGEEGGPSERSVSFVIAVAGSDLSVASDGLEMARFFDWPVFISAVVMAPGGSAVTGEPGTMGTEGLFDAAKIDGGGPEVLPCKS